MCFTWSCGGCGRRGAHRWRGLNPAFFHHLLRFKDTLAAIQAGTLKTTRSYIRSPNGGQSHDCRNNFTFSAVTASEHQLPTRNMCICEYMYICLQVYICVFLCILVLQPSTVQTVHAVYRIQVFIVYMYMCICVCLLLCSFQCF